VAKLAKSQVLYETGHGKIYFGVTIETRIHAWPVMRMRSRKVTRLAEAKTWSICQNFTSKRKRVWYNFATKVVEWPAKNSIVGNKSRMRTDRPKYARMTIYL